MADIVEVNVYDGRMGPQGPQGEPGPQGEQGPQGIQGETGPPGTTDYLQLTNRPPLGTAAAADTTDFATAAQGAKADSAVQPEELAVKISSVQEDGVGTLITNHIALTQAQYDGLAVKNPSTVYEIIEP